MRKIKIPINEQERKIIISALIDFRNMVLKQGRYVDSIDELLLKVNKTKGAMQL